MGYNLNQFTADYLRFSSQFNQAYQDNYNNLMNTLSDMENITNDDVTDAIDEFNNDVKRQIDNSIDDVVNSQNVAGNEAATNLWSDIKNSVSNAWHSIYEEICPICQGDMLPPEKIDYIQRECQDLPAFALLTKVSATHGIEIIGANTLPEWNYGDDPSQRAWYDTWWDFYKTRKFFKDILNNISSFFTSAQQFLRTVFADPLVLDLDGDGIETLSVNSGNPVYFDFNSDGTKTNTGWISPDDAYLVFDRNDNGVIDNASELFSDYTPLYAGGRASNGFVALTQEDTNADGVVNALDARWSNLKIWRDLNSDGISQANELRTMEEAGIIGINTARADTSQTFANGNAIRGTGTYMKADGTIGDMGDAYYAVDTVNQQFTNPIPISPEVEALPNVQGMGLVRDLRQAAELSPVLQYLLTQYSQASTRQEQMAIIDQLLYAWADTSGMAATMESVKDEYLQKAA